MDRLLTLLEKREKLLSIYITAGYPTLGSTVALCKELEASGVDLIEIGFPFSDPLADGPVIQRSSEMALKNGMSLSVLFEQLRQLRAHVSIPCLLMGYLNPVMQFGVDNFIEQSCKVGIEGVILPDLPREEYLRQYRTKFENAGLHFIPLISPTTSEQRIHDIDQSASAFIYAVSSTAITGNPLALDAERSRYFKSLEELKLRHPILVGFGISDSKSFDLATRCTRGAIIGSAFIAALGASAKDPLSAVRPFINSIRYDR